MWFPVVPSRVRGSHARARAGAGAAAGLAVLVLIGAWLWVSDDVAAQSAGRWGWLGVRIRDLSEQEMEEISARHGIREGFGAVVVEVIKETPAERAGLRSGDLVVAFRDRPVVDTRTLQRLVSGTDVGEMVVLTVLRREEGRRRVSVGIGAMPEPVIAERVAAEFGFLVRDGEGRPDVRDAPRIADQPAAVVAVLQGSGAESAGLRVGDVLIEVNGRPVLTGGAVRQALLGVALDQPLPLTVRRGDGQVQVVIPGPRSP
jgi:serine protease Do